MIEQDIGTVSPPSPEEIVWAALPVRDHQCVFTGTSRRDAFSSVCSGY